MMGTNVIIIMTPYEFLIYTVKLFYTMKNLISKEEKDRIDSTCIQYKIPNYTINADGSIDINGDVKVWSIGMTSLPLRFGKVSGNFNVRLNDLTTLIGSPHIVGGDFNCENNNLSSLDGCPEYVGGEFWACGNNLTSTYTGDNDIEVVGDFYSDLDDNIDRNNLPRRMHEYKKHIKLILKYQRYYMIWNDDLSLNEENFNDLITDIEEGLE